MVSKGGRVKWLNSHDVQDTDSVRLIAPTLRTYKGNPPYNLNFHHMVSMMTKHPPQPATPCRHSVKLNILHMFRLCENPIKKLQKRFKNVQAHTSDFSTLNFPKNFFTFILANSENNPRLNGTLLPGSFLCFFCHANWHTNNHIRDNLDPTRLKKFSKEVFTWV